MLVTARLSGGQLHITWSAAAGRGLTAECGALPGRVRSGSGAWYRSILDGVDALGGESREAVSHGLELLG